MTTDDCISTIDSTINYISVKIAKLKTYDELSKKLDELKVMLIIT